jgi:hypothetical protein
MDEISGKFTLSVQQLNILVNEIFLKSNQEGAKLWRFTEKKLKQFSLNKAYQPEAIFTIAYERTRKAIEEEGKQIKSESIIPWFKSVIFNIVRELRRERDKENVKRYDKPIEEIAESYDVEENISWEEHSSREKYEQLIECLKQLSPLEQELIQLRAEQGLPWKNVRDNLSDQGYSITSELALRQRYSRLRAKLKAHIE